MTSTLGLRPGDRPQLREVAGLIRGRSVQAALLGWVLVNVLLIVLAGGYLPFHASALARPPTLIEVLTTNAMFVEVFFQMIVVHFLTRKRTVPDIAERAPATTRARAEMLAVLTALRPC